MDLLKAVPIVRAGKLAVTRSGTVERAGALSNRLDKLAVAIRRFASLV